jgi:primosomal replication protein N
VNKVFLAGKVWKTPEVAFTPKGKRIMMFPLWIEEGDFSIEVVYAGEYVPRAVDKTVGGRVMVAGELVKAKLQSRDVMKVKANKILWMEE